MRICPAKQILHRERYYHQPMPHSKRTLGGVVGGILGLVGLSAVAGLLVTATVTPAIALSGYTASGAMTMFENIPADLEVDQPMLPTTIYVENDKGKNVELATFYDQNRIPLEYEDLPQVVIDAVLSSEDPRFYDHGGVDLIGTSRALLQNAGGGSTQGASTITQQFVKNVLVQRCEAGTSEDLPDDFDSLASEDQQAAIIDCYNEQTDSSGTEGYQRKLQEMRFAIAIEKKYTKEQILLGYLNFANFGGQTYGIEAAAKRYFGKSVKDITIGEAAILAGVVQNPNLLRIDKKEGTREIQGEMVNSAEDGYRYAKSRQNYVLNRMLEDGKITDDQHDKYHDAEIKPNITSRTQGCQQAGDAAYFCEYVRQTVLNDEAFGESADERRQVLSRGGLKIYTTLNPFIQQAAEDAINNYAPQTVDGMNFGSTVVTVDPRTGDILAMAQNTDYSLSPNHSSGDGYTSLVYAAGADRGHANGFSAGSTYKMFTLLDWLESGRSVRESIDGTSRPFNMNVCGAIQQTEMRNFGGIQGRVSTPMDFTSASLNTGFMAMAEQLDICGINKVADRLGVTLGNGKKVTEENVPNNVIGDKAITPIDLASAYGTVANGGVLCDQRAIKKAIDPDGEEMTLPEHDCKKVLEPEVAATASYALAGVMNGGTGSGGNPYDGTPLIGKTGTHQDLQTMLVESSTRAATAGWAGNASGEGPIFANGLQSIRYNIARETQRAANAQLGSDPFPSPDSELTRVILADIPNVKGMSVGDATAAIEEAGFNARVGSSVAGTEPEGTVHSTDPGGSAPSGSIVTIHPSNGNGVSVPDVSGMSVSDARGAIQSAGLNTSLGSCKKNGDLDEDRARGTDPSGGSVVSSGSTVTIEYSSKSCGGGDDDDDGNNGNGNGNGGNGNGNNDDDD